MGQTTRDCLELFIALLATIFDFSQQSEQVHSLSKSHSAQSAVGTPPSPAKRSPRVGAAVNGLGVASPQARGAAPAATGER